MLDVTDPGGKRVNRFTGEEVVPGNASRDPWAAITPTVAQSVAGKATGSFAAWLPNGRANSASNTAGPPAGVGVPKNDPPAASPRTARPAAAAKQNVAATPAASGCSNHGQHRSRG